MKRALAGAVAVLAVALAAVLIRGNDPDPEVARLKDAIADRDTVIAFQVEVIEEQRRKSVADSIRADSLLAAERQKTRIVEQETDSVLATLPDSIRSVVEPAVQRERQRHEAEKESMRQTHAQALQNRSAEILALTAQVDTLTAQVNDYAALVGRLESKMAPTFSVFGIGLNVECKPGIGPSLDVSHTGDIRTSVARLRCEVTT
jgi:hypothetical protein